MPSPCSCSQFFMDIPSPEEPPWGCSAVVKGENKTEKGLVFALQYSYGQISLFGCTKLSSFTFKICLGHKFLVTLKNQHMITITHIFTSTVGILCYNFCKAGGRGLNKFSLGDNSNLVVNLFLGEKGEVLFPESQGTTSC